MADFSFLHVFGLSLIATTCRVTIFNPMSIGKKMLSQVKVGDGKGNFGNPLQQFMQVASGGGNIPGMQNATSKPKSQRKLTQEEKNYELAQREIDRMKKEVKQYETPDHYAKFGKMNRQILKMEKELAKLKVLADQSQLTGNSIEDDTDSQLLVEEEKKVEDVPLVPDTPPTTPPQQESKEDSMSWKLKLHILGTLLFMMVFYVIPLGFTGFIFSNEASQSIHTLVDPGQLGPFIANRLFTNVKWNGKVYGFLPFRITYILCLWVSSTIVELVKQVYVEANKEKPKSKPKDDELKAKKLN